MYIYIYYIYIYIYLFARNMFRVVSGAYHTRQATVAIDII